MVILTNPLKLSLFAVIDIETTGGNMLNDRITEIAIILHNGHRIIEEYSTLVNPLRPIQPFVAALTGITNEMVIDAPTFDEISDKIFELTQNKIIVAHNASFDYGFLKNEYKRGGKRFRRKTLCTVKTSRKVFPHKVSYGLGNLCRDLEIEIYDRHRAHGDASATAILLEKLIFNDKKKIIKDLLNGELATTHLPEKITAALVDELPEEIGVYYFLNEKGKVIYVGKSKNIRERVISHFRNDSNRAAPIKMKEQIHDITYEITGDELVALLLESDEIKRWMPAFNKAQRRQHYRYGLFLNKDQNDYLKFDINLLHPDRKEFHKFRSKRRAEVFLNNLEKKSNIAPEFKSTISAETYNKLVKRAIQKYQYPYEQFLIIGHGRIEGEKSAVLVEDDKYIGYGYFEPIMTGSDIKAIVSCIKPFRNNQDTRSIILSYLRKTKKKSNLFPF